MAAPALLGAAKMAKGAGMIKKVAASKTAANALQKRNASAAPKPQANGNKSLMEQRQGAIRFPNNGM